MDETSDEKMIRRLSELNIKQKTGDHPSNRETEQGEERHH